MRYLLSCILLFCTAVYSYSQGETNNWYFGSKAALNFATGHPQPVFNSQMNANEGCSAISDKNGNLLFYSDGYYIWNKNHQRMTDPNTGWLITIGDDGLGTQTGVIIPWPGRDSLYFVFSIGQLGGNLYYSVVNMNRNGGLGEVIIIKTLLLSNVCEKLTAVKHCNKTEFWAITRKFDSDQYYSYLVSFMGISTAPVISNTGILIMNDNPGGSSMRTLGYLKNSPDGRKLAAAHHSIDFIELTDFNTTTGAVSNAKTLFARPAGIIPPIFDGAYGVEFSPDSRLLYVSAIYHLADTSGITQFDVTLSTESAIQASAISIYNSSSFNAPYSMQLGPDKKIYVAEPGYYLGIINEPQIQGTGCNFNFRALNIDDGSGTHQSSFGLPNFVQSYFNDPLIAIGNCQFSTINFSLHNLTSIIGVEWDFGDPASGINNTSTSFTPTHVFTQEGQYTVRSVISHANGCGIDTIYKIVYAGPFRVFLGNDTTICQGDTLKLKMRINNAGNLWNNGSTDTLISITQAGTYWVKVSLGECTTSDTINVTVRSLPAFSLGNDQTICSYQSLILSPTPNPANVSYLWSTGVTSASINTISDGLYWLQVTENGYGCRYRDSINVVFKTLPEYSLGADKTICEKDTVVLDATVNGATSYSWNTGSTSSRIKAYNNGIYWADVSKDGCVFRDSVQLTLKPLPVVNLGIDSTLCEGNILRLDAGNNGSQYLWQNNSTGQFIDINKPGVYYVKVIMNGCVSSDTINIKYNYKPVFSLGKDTVICNGQSIVLNPTIQNGTNNISFLWNTGDISPAITINQPGYYQLSISNYCGTRNDEIKVSDGVCKLYVPTAFTPNNDGKNDVFKASYGENVTSYQMDIYNRWGQKIFSSNQINNGWDGKLKGEIQPGDVYVWIIRYKVLNNTKEYSLKGTMTLIR